MLVIRNVSIIGPILQGKSDYIPFRNCEFQRVRWMQFSNVKFAWMNLGIKALDPLPYIKWIARADII